MYNTYIDTVSAFICEVIMIKGTPELISKRREEIINACEKLYQTLSFKDITLKDISKETSFSRPTIYNYFQTKEEIFLALYEREYDPEDAYVGGGKETVIRRENDTFYVEGAWLLNLMGQINFDDYESLNFFQRVLQRSGVFEALEEKGCRDGNTVSIYDFAFEYVK